VRSLSGNYIVAGIVSFGFECNYENKPGFYTSVPKLMKWIKATIS